jgi:hypothetical protein
MGLALLTEEAIMTELCPCPSLNLLVYFVLSIFSNHSYFYSQRKHLNTLFPLKGGGKPFLHSVNFVALTYIFLNNYKLCSHEIWYTCTDRLFEPTDFFHSKTLLNRLYIFKILIYDGVLKIICKIFKYVAMKKSQ